MANIAQMKYGSARDPMEDNGDLNSFRLTKVDLEHGQKNFTNGS
jgi:hypothetical protein